MDRQTDRQKYDSQGRPRICSRGKKGSHSKVTICRRQWCHPIGHIQFRFSLLLQLCLYLAPFPRYYDLFSKIHEVTWLWTHTFRGNLSCAYLVLLCVNQYTALAVPTCTDFKDTIGANIFKRATWPWPRPLGDSLLSRG